MIFEAYVAAGGTTFDTSDIYQDGEAEFMLGELLGRDRDDFVIITKYSGSRNKQPRPGTTGNSRKHDPLPRVQPETAEHRLHRRVHAALPG
jgi:aryl-alcohol dehydrogenase-like predicted oxidoreductase